MSKYRIEIMDDGPRGGNSVLIDSMESNKPSELFGFVEENEYKLFSYKPELLNYVAEAIEEIASDYQNKVALINKIIKLNNEFNDTEDEKTWEQRNSAIESLMQNEQVCAKVLDVINYYNIGVNFKKVSE